MLVVVALFWLSASEVVVLPPLLLSLVEAELALSVSPTVTSPTLVELSVAELPLLEMSPVARLPSCAADVPAAWQSSVVYALIHTAVDDVNHGRISPDAAQGALAVTLRAALTA